MDSATLFLVLAIAGVNFGWQPAEDGSPEYEYIVQVEPELVDALKRGDAIPIESNIPPQVAPIRKVRVVVGRGELPRTPIRHSANFADDTGWTPDRYSPAPPPPATNRYSGQAPSLVDRTGTAISETGNALTSGVQAGVRSANDQLSRSAGQVTSDTQNAARQFGEQLQQRTDSTGQQVQSAGNSLRSATQQGIDSSGNQIRQVGDSIGLTGATAPNSRGVSAPPWSTAPAPAVAPTTWPLNSATNSAAVVDGTAPPSMSITRTATGWTSIGSNVAAPPLLNPPMPTTPVNNGLRVAQVGTAGPSFPSASSGAPVEPIHSVLVDPSRQPPTTGNSNHEWGDSWESTGPAATPATIDRSGSGTRVGDGSSNAGLVPVRPRYPGQQGAQPATSPWGESRAEDDPWIDQAQQGQAPQIVGNRAASGQAPQYNDQPANQLGPVQNNTFAGNQPTAAPSRAAIDSGRIGTGPDLQNGAPLTGNFSGTNLPGEVPAGRSPDGNQSKPTPEPLPWLPLLLVTLALVGSVSANFFLGMSYLGARQKYVSLVQRTAGSLRRAAGIVAA